MYYVLGFLAGLIIGGIILAVFFKVTKTDGKMKCKFDERQQIVRGKGFEWGFFTLLIYNALLLFMDSVLDAGDMKIFSGLSSEVLIFVGILLGVFVYGSYCIWNEGYFSLNENPKRLLIGFGLLALANFVIGFNRMAAEEQQGDVLKMSNSMNLLCAIFMLIFMAEILVKWICDKKGEKAA